MIILSKNLATRLSAQKLFAELLKNNVKQLDFRNVELVSRSFANEFYNLEIKHNYKVKKLNLSKELKFMFDNANKELDSNILSKNKYTTVSAQKYASLI